MTTLAITSSATTASESSRWSPRLAAAAAGNGWAAPRIVPPFIGADEAYYWSFPWQEDVRAAMTARAAGESVLFDSDDPNDVVRWLLSEDDDEA